MTDTPQPEVGGKSTCVGTSHYALASFGLIAMAACACLLWLGQGPLLDDHEAINAQGARQTLESGQWLIPRVSEITWVRKPPLGIWLIAAAAQLVDGPSVLRPVTELSARLPSAIAGILNALVVWWLGTMLFGRRAGLVAGAVMACCVATFYYGRNAQVDMLLTLLTTLSYACFWRGAMHERPSPVFMVLFYAALAAAMMAKAPLPLVVVGFALAMYWFVTLPLLTANEQGEGSFAKRATAATWAQMPRLWRLWLIPGIVLFVVLAGAWPFYIHKHVPNAMALWNMEYLDRYSGGLSKVPEPFYYYIGVAFALTVPFLLSLPEAVAAVFLKRYREQRTGLAFAMTWAVVGTVFLSTASYKRPHYLLSVIPAYCLLLAPVIERMFFGAIAARQRSVWLACAAVSIGLGIGFAVGAQVMSRQFPEFQQTYVVAATMLWTLWTLAAIAYAIGRRAASFGLLCAWVLVIAMVIWPGLGKSMHGEPDLVGLVREMKAKRIPTDAPIYWVEGRPDSSIEFYYGYRVQRLIDEFEMSRIREDRSEVGADLLRVIAGRIEKQLARPEPVYLIMRVGNYELMQRETHVRGRILIEQNGYKEFPGDEWMVVTQLVRATPTARPAR